MESLPAVAGPPPPTTADAVLLSDSSSSTSSDSSSDDSSSSSSSSSSSDSDSDSHSDSDSSSSSSSSDDSDSSSSSDSSSDTSDSDDDSSDSGSDVESSSRNNARARSHQLPLPFSRLPPSPSRPSLRPAAPFAPSTGIVMGGSPWRTAESQLAPFPLTRREGALTSAGTGRGKGRSPGSGGVFGLVRPRDKDSPSAGQKRPPEEEKAGLFWQSAVYEMQAAKQKKAKPQLPLASFHDDDDDDDDGGEDSKGGGGKWAGAVAQLVAQRQKQEQKPAELLPAQPRNRVVLESDDDTS